MGYVCAKQLFEDSVGCFRIIGERHTSALSCALTDWVALPTDANSGVVIQQAQVG